MMEPTTIKQDLLRRLPSVDSLLSTPAVQSWLAEQPHSVVADSLRDTLDELRQQILSDQAGRCGAVHVTQEFIVSRAEARLIERTRPHIRAAINATGVILHTGLGRAVWPACVVDSMVEELKGYVTLAIDRETGQRLERDHHIEYILTELTGAEAATVVNNNAAATMLVLAALAGGKEAIVSRGQLIEIGGSFRLPDVMAQSNAKMVEVGTTNRTHLRDYENAINENTAILLRAHPSNFRVVGFTKSVSVAELAGLAKERGLKVVDDLGAGALLNLEDFGLPHEPTMRESIEAGADVVLASGDKLMGASQAGVIVGSRECIERIRRHPLARAFRADKTCLMALERTLHLFRDPKRLVREHPTYRMLSRTPPELQQRAADLQKHIAHACPTAQLRVIEGVGYLGSGSLPMEQLATWLVAVQLPAIKPAVFAKRLREGEPSVFARIEDDTVLFDVRTMEEDQLPLVARVIATAAQKESA